MLSWVEHENSFITSWPDQMYIHMYVCTRQNAQWSLLSGVLIFQESYMCQNVYWSQLHVPIVLFNISGIMHVSKCLLIPTTCTYCVVWYFRNQLKSSIVMMQESIEGQFFNLAEQVMTSDQLQGADDICKAIDSITKDQVVAVSSLSQLARFNRSQNQFFVVFFLLKIMCAVHQGS